MTFKKFTLSLMMAAGCSLFVAPEAAMALGGPSKTEMTATKKAQGRLQRLVDGLQGAGWGVKNSRVEALKKPLAELHQSAFIAQLDQTLALRTKHGASSKKAITAMTTLLSTIESAIPTMSTSQSAAEGTNASGDLYEASLKKAINAKSAKTAIPVSGIVFANDQYGGAMKAMYDTGLAMAQKLVPGATFKVYVENKIDIPGIDVRMDILTFVTIDPAKISALPGNQKPYVESKYPGLKLGDVEISVDSDLSNALSKKKSLKLSLMPNEAGVLKQVKIDFDTKTSW